MTINELSETERFWMTRTIKNYIKEKERLMHPKDLNVLTTLLGKLAISEKAYKVKIEIEKL